MFTISFLPLAALVRAPFTPLHAPVEGETTESRDNKDKVVKGFLTVADGRQRGGDAAYDSGKKKAVDASVGERPGVGS